MKKTLLILSLVALGYASGNAQVATLNTGTGDGNDGDVWLGFGSTSASGVNNYTYELDLGSIKQFLTVAPGATYSNFLGAGSASLLQADLNQFYSTTGTGWTNTVTIGLFGGVSGQSPITGVANNTYLVGNTNSTRLGNAGSVANLGASEVLLNSSSQDPNANGYNNAGVLTYNNANVQLANNAIGSYNAASSGSGHPGWAALQFGGPANTYNSNGGLAYRNWAQALTFTGLPTLYINEILPTGVTQVIGTFNIGSSGSLSFTASAVPEPSTLPLALLAVVGMAVFVARKKLRKASL